MKSILRFVNVSILVFGPLMFVMLLLLPCMKSARAEKAQDAVAAKFPGSKVIYSGENSKIVTFVVIGESAASSGLFSFDLGGETVSSYNKALPAFLFQWVIAFLAFAYSAFSAIGFLRNRVP